MEKIRVKINYYFLVINLIFLPSCHKNISQKSLSQKDASERPGSENFMQRRVKQGVHKLAYLSVDEVECDICAKIVLDKIVSLDGVVSARYEFDDEEYENNKIRVVYDDSIELQKDEIQRALSQEDFSLSGFELA